MRQRLYLGKPTSGAISRVCPLPFIAELAFYHGNSEHQIDSGEAGELAFHGRQHNQAEGGGHIQHINAGLRILRGTGPSVINTRDGRAIRGRIIAIRLGGLDGL
ncbi:hypothetical protein ACTVH1_12140 [Gluconobacter cerinus]